VDHEGHSGFGPLRPLHTLCTWLTFPWLRETKGRRRVPALLAASLPVTASRGSLPQRLPMIPKWWPHAGSFSSFFITPPGIRPEFLPVSGVVKRVTRLRGCPSFITPLFWCLSRFSFPVDIALGGRQKSGFPGSMRGFFLLKHPFLSILLSNTLAFSPSFPSFQLFVCECRYRI